MGENHTSGREQFIAANIVGILQAIPASDGSYADVCQRAENQGVSLSPYTISRWVNNGRADLRRGYRATGYARFASEYDRRTGKISDAEADRTGEIGHTLAELDNRCACGNERAKRPDGTFDEAYPQCLEMDRPRE